MDAILSQTYSCQASLDRPVRPTVSLVSRVRTHLKKLSKVSGIQPRCFLCVVTSSYLAAFSHLSVLFIAGLLERLEWRLTVELMSVEEPEHASAEAPEILGVLWQAQYRCLHYSNALFNGSPAERNKLKS